MVCLTTLFKELPSLARVMCSEHLGAFNIVCIRRRCLTLSCINLGMSHKMLFYIRSMIYIDTECLQSCEAREKFTMLNAKDVYPRWQKSSIPKNMFYQSGPWFRSVATFRDDYTHMDVVGWQANVKI